VQKDNKLTARTRKDIKLTARTRKDIKLTAPVQKGVKSGVKRSKNGVKSGVKRCKRFIIQLYLCFTAVLPLYTPPIHPPYTLGTPPRRCYPVYRSSCSPSCTLKKAAPAMISAFGS